MVSFRNRPGKPGFGHKRYFPTGSKFFPRCTYEWHVYGDESELPFGSTRQEQTMTQSVAVQQHVFAGHVGQVQPVLNEVHARPALQAHWRAAVARLQVMRLDHAAKLGSRHNLLHRGQKHIALGRTTVLLEPSVLVGGYGEGLLLHA